MVVNILVPDRLAGPSRSPYCRRQPIISLHDLCLDSLSYQLRLFGAKTFQLLILFNFDWFLYQILHLDLLYLFVLLSDHGKPAFPLFLYFQIKYKDGGRGGERFLIQAHARSSTPVLTLCGHYKLFLTQLKINPKTTLAYFEALESVMCDVIKIHPKRRDVTRIKAPPRIW